MDAYLNKECKGKTIFVTGGAGFVGSEIVRQISASGGTAIVYDNLSSGKKKFIQNYPRVKIIKGDVKNRLTIHKAIQKSQYIINLAALPFIPDSFHYPQEFFEVNTNGTLNLILESINHKKIKNFVHISTSEVYGSAKKSPMDENHPILPQSTYAVSKLAGEKAVFTMHKEHDFPAVMIRPFNTYGPNITQPYIIPEIIMQVLGKNSEIKLGNINAERDFTFVSDTANGIIRALFSKKAIGETINLGSGRSHKIKDIVKSVSSILEKKVTISTNKDRLRPFDVNKLVCDNRKAKKMLDWEPKITFDEGLKNTINWIKENSVELRTPFRGWPKQYRKIGK
jgi:nucleoside-diphosphate-sugar epimerase